MKGNCLRRVAGVAVMALACAAGMSARGEFTAVDSLMMYHESTALNSGKIQQEMVYLHLDNSSYYRGDRLYFAGYLVTSGKLRPSEMSRTVYVELLNPGGKVIDRCILRPEGGRFHGSLAVDEQPFYSGYYEVRAYTRYMLNFGPEALFSKVVPVFKAPKTEGNWAERTMTDYGRGGLPYNRPAPKKERAEATPDGNGIDLDVDNSQADAVRFTVRRAADSPLRALGASLTCRNELCGRVVLDLSETPEAEYSFPRAKLPMGVIQLTLFNAAGQPVADRLFFNNGEDFVNIEYRFDKPSYGPMEPVELTLKLTDAATGLPSTAPFSLSVSDADNRVSDSDNILSGLLLAPETEGHQAPALEQADSVLAAQSWRRHSWSRLAGMELFSLDSVPETALQVHGRVINRRRNTPVAGAQVSAMVTRASKAERDTAANRYRVLGTFPTDADGRFTFDFDVMDKHILTLSAADSKGKPKPYRILLNSGEIPAPRAYEEGEMKFRVEESAAALADTAVFAAGPDSRVLQEVEVTADAPWDAWRVMDGATACYDIEAAYGALLDKGKRHIRTLADILPLIDSNFARSGAFIDSSQDYEYSLDRSLRSEASEDGEKVYFANAFTYRGKAVLFMIDPELGNNKTALNDFFDEEFYDPVDLALDAIKNVYVSTDDEAMAEQIVRMSRRSDHDIRNLALEDLGCVVFIELHPELRVRMRPGMRRATLEGYTATEEFHSPDYSDVAAFPTDFRRTLYWAPTVTPDADGTATVRFYNNSRTRRFHVSAATLTPSGAPGATL